MIIIERTITIKNDQATLDSPIYLYRGDGDIVCLFTIKEMKKAATFGKIEANNPVSQASYGNVRIYKPDGSKCVFTEKSPIVDDKLQVTFSYENINDFTEVGVHKLQIHLYDDNDAHNESNDKNRFTLPPVDLHVLLPVGDDNNQIDEAIVGYSLLNAVDEDVPTFDEEGNYNKTIWETGDIITQGKLNKIEDALYEISTADDNYVTNEVLEAELDGIEAALKGKANVSHNHSNYAPTNHNHSGYAANNHTHSNYATSNHTHTEYAAKTELEGKADYNHNHNGIYAAVSHTHAGYAANNHTHDGYLTEIPNTYATKKYVSDFVEDSGFITSIPSTYITETELENELGARGYASEDFVIRKVTEAQLGGGNPGDPSELLKNYATIAQLNTKADIAHNHDGRYLTEVPTTYATKKYVDDAIGNINIPGGNIDPSVLSNYPTIDVMNEALAGKADNGHTHDGYSTTGHTHEDYALKSEIPDMVTVPTNISAFTNDAGYITSNGVIRIEIVTELPDPDDELPGVLYIVKE